jgi:hypothetical protein
VLATQVTASPNPEEALDHSRPPHPGLLLLDDVEHSAQAILANAPKPKRKEKGSMIVTFNFRGHE